MERLPFFPDPYFGWIFYAVLVAFTLVGACLDLRKAVLPKKLTLSLLAVGIVFNIVRGAWIGSLGREIELFNWRLPTHESMWRGGLYGFLFSLVGFTLTTILFVVFWVMKLCGGGDVKLFAALGAWIGFSYSIFVMLGSVIVMVVLLIGRLLAGGLSPMAVRKRLKQSQVIQGGPGKGKWKMTYALPVAVAVAVVLLWVYRFDLNLAVRSKAGSAPSHAEAQHD